MHSPADDQKALLTELSEISLLSSTAQVLGWDEQTQLPSKGSAYRGDQVGLLARLAHERLTAPGLSERLSRLAQSPSAADPLSDLAVNVRETRHAVDRATKMPAALVEELARVSSTAQHAWVTARKASDFPAFAPWLEKLLHLKRQQSACYGSGAHPYDALLDEYEPGYTTADIAAVFGALKGPLVELIRKIGESPVKNDGAVLNGSYSRAQQEAFAREAAAAIQFDFDAGRLDVSAHPFCTTLGPYDTRITTRYDEKAFAGSFFGVLHETGHALYMQGLPAEHFGTPRGNFVSMGIHESQSRLWENLVGRSRPFWKHFLPKAKTYFPGIANVSEDEWYRAVNQVHPGFIRVDADETTYNLHVLLRFELETAMMSGDLSVNELPGAWNEKMKAYLGLTPPNDALGVLQDVHWSGGGIGYFPTYTLGNLAAAQFFEAARKDLGDLDAQFARGEFAPLLGWLREHIHSQGMRYSARDLVKKVTGAPLGTTALLTYLNKKAAEVYQVSSLRPAGAASGPDSTGPRP